MTEQSGLFIKELEKRMSNQNKLRKLENKKIELVRKIQLCEHYKEKIIRFVQELNNQYHQGLVSYKEYYYKLNRALEQRTPEQWIQEYDSSIWYYKHSLDSCEREIKKQENKTKIAPLVTILAVFMILGFGFLFLKPAITGLIVGIGEEAYTQDINLVVNESSGYEWQPDHAGILRSAGISGKILGDGIVRVYLDDKLILDGSKLEKSGISMITGLAISDLTETKDSAALGENITSITEETENITAPEILEIENITNTTVPEENITIPEEIEANITIPEEINVSENITLPEEAVPELPEENITVPVPELVEVNITEIIFTDVCIETCSLELNKTSYELRFEIDNAVLYLDSISYTIQPIEILEEVPKLIENISKAEETIQGQAEINKPVKWTKKITLNETSSNLTVKLPKNISNIKVSKIKDKIKEEISSDKLKIREAEQLKPISLITGYAVKEPSSEKKPQKENEEVKEETELVIEDSVREIEIEYYTEAPGITEKEINAYKKQIVVSSDVHYTNITAYTTITEAPEASIKLYKITEGIREPVQIINYTDTNNNSLIDKISWVVPSLSNETYELEIIILNVQSYPTVGGNWTVRFNTIGIANLTITAVDGTTWSNENENNDLKFLEVKCGDEILDYEWVNNSIFIENYECNETGYEISKVLTPGKHHLEFNFGGIKVYANNDAGAYETGHVEVNGWTTVNLVGTYTTPIVLAYGRIDYNGVAYDDEIANPIVTNVTSTSFRINMYEDDGAAHPGNASYIVVENGTTMLENGMLLQAGKIEGITNYNVVGAGGAAYQTITYWQPYSSAPSVFASAMNDSLTEWMGARYNNLGTTSVQLSLEREELASATGAPGILAWMAINRTTATDMEAGYDSSLAADPLAGTWEGITFSNTYNYPLFFGLTDEVTGTDSGKVGIQNLNETYVDTRFTETYTDGEYQHADEGMTWIVFESGLGNAPPTTPTNITCNDNNNCNISIDTGVNLTGTGSTDPDNDNITYFIEAALPGEITTDDQELGTSQAIAEASSGSGYNETIEALNPEARWMLESDGSDCTGNEHNPEAGSGPAGGFVTSIIPNPPTPHCADWNTDTYDIPDHYKINTGTGGTYYGYQRALSVWIVADTIDTSGAGRGIWTEGGTTNSMNMYVFNNGTSNNIYCNADEAAGGAYVAYPISTGTLYHVGCMFDFNGEGMMYMYINGTLVGSADTSILGTSLNAHGNDNAIGGVDQNTKNHADAQLSGFFDGRIADLVYWSDGYVITEQNFIDIYNAGAGIGQEPDTEAAKDWETYNDVATFDRDTITTFVVNVSVSSYNNAGSTNNSNNNPDLQLEVYNGTDFVEIGNFSVNQTGNFNLSVTDASVLYAWKTAVNTNLRIRGVNFDYNSSSYFDEINWTGVWVTLDGIVWLEIGNHTNETTSTFEWNTTDIAEQNCIDLRTRAIDLDGTNTYSDYFTKNACLNISHVVAEVTATAEIGTFDPSTINEDQSSVISGTCTPSGGTLNNAYMILQDNQTGVMATTPDSADSNDIYANVSYYYLEDISSAQTRWFNVTGVNASIYNFTIQCNGTEASDNSTSTFLTVQAAENQPPVVNYVSLITPQSVSAGTVAYISFTFNATDADGADNLNNSAARASFNLTGETTRTNTSCSLLAQSGNTRQYNCTIGIWYWDGAGNWTINASIEDEDGAYAENSSTTFELLETTAMVMSPTALTWDSLSLTDTNKTSNNDPIVINNTANKNIVYVNVTAIDLQGAEITSDFIYANNFTVDIDTGDSCSGDACLECDGTVMVNNTAKAVSGATIPKGNNSAGQGQEELYFCLNGMLQTISAQTYSTALGQWTISIS